MDSVHATTGFTPFFLNYGRHPRLPMHSYLNKEEAKTLQEWMVELHTSVAQAREAAEMNTHENKEKQRDYTNDRREAAYSVGDSVY